MGGAYGFLHYLIFPPVIPAACAASLSPVYTCTKTPHLSITCHEKVISLISPGGCSNTCPGDCPHTPFSSDTCPLQPSPLWSAGRAPLLSFLLELYCVYQGNDSKAGYMWAYCVCLDKHTAMFNSYQLWLMNFSGFLRQVFGPTMVSTTSILDQRNYKPIRFDLAEHNTFLWTNQKFWINQSHQSFWLESTIYVVSGTNLLWLPVSSWLFLWSAFEYHSIRLQLVQPCRMFNKNPENKPVNSIFTQLWIILTFEKTLWYSHLKHQAHDHVTETNPLTKHTLTHHTHTLTRTRTLTHNTTHTHTHTTHNHTHTHTHTTHTHHPTHTTHTQPTLTHTHTQSHTHTHTHTHNTHTQLFSNPVFSGSPGGLCPLSSLLQLTLGLLLSVRSRGTEGGSGGSGL